MAEQGEFGRAPENQGGGVPHVLTIDAKLLGDKPFAEVESRRARVTGWMSAFSGRVQKVGRQVIAENSGLSGLIEDEGTKIGFDLKMFEQMLLALTYRPAVGQHRLRGISFTEYRFGFPINGVAGEIYAGDTHRRNCWILSKPEAGGRQAGESIGPMQQLAVTVWTPLREFFNLTNVQVGERFVLRVDESESIQLEELVKEGLLSVLAPGRTPGRYTGTVYASGVERSAVARQETDVGRIEDDLRGYPLTIVEFDLRETTVDSYRRKVFRQKVGLEMRINPGKVVLTPRLYHQFAGLPAPFEPIEMIAIKSDLVEGTPECELITDVFRLANVARIAYGATQGDINGKPVGKRKK